MKKGRRKGSKKVNSHNVVYGSDDERAYSNEPVPDKQSSDYYMDEVDQFHAKRDKILLDKGKEDEDDSDRQEEVLGFDDESDDDFAMYRQFRANQKKDTMASDLEDNEDQDEEEDVSWGKKKSVYFGADVTYVGQLAETSEEAAVILEEQEALALQKKMAQQLDDADFEIDFFQSYKDKPDTSNHESDKEESVKVAKDFSKLSRDEKLQLLKKESPELLGLIEECKDKLSEANQLHPLFKKIRNGQIPPSKACSYVETRMTVLLNYSVNLIFYLMLKAKKTPVQHHPVIKRLFQYQQIIETLEPIQQQIQPEIDRILTKIENNDPLNFKHSDENKIGLSVTNQKSGRTTKLSKHKLRDLMSDDEDEESLGDEEEIASTSALPSDGGRTWGRKRMKSNDPEYEEYNEGDDDIEEAGLENEDGKRGITYQIEKNKGLTPHRKKEYRNPRVKHRIKYRKAKIRRKGMIREPRTEMTRYGGELSGIRAGIKRSIKLK